MKICVVGLWHLGCVTSACLAKLGHTVVGVDANPTVVKDLQNGKAPFFEPGLDSLMAQNVRRHRLSFSSDPGKAVRSSKVIWVAYDTPVKAHDVADTFFIEKKLQELMPHLISGAKIVVSSQVPVGFMARIENSFRKKFPHKKCYFAYTPENLRLGKAIGIFLNPDRIVIGVRDSASRQAFLPLFSSMTPRLEWMRTESAEMTKHAINAFLAASVCFTNEVASLCEQVGADAREVERGLKTESRIGPRAYLGPGTAYSGGTLARDIRFLIQTSQQHKLPSYLIRAVKRSNDFHKTWIERQCLALRNIRNKKIAVLGLAYKPGTSILRRSLAVDLAKTLRAHGAFVIGYDPIIKKLPKNLSGRITLMGSLSKAIRDSKLVIVTAAFPEIQAVGRETENLLKKKWVIDPNGFLSKKIGTANRRYFCIGKGNPREKRP